MADLSPTDTFVERHLGPSVADQAKMLSELGFATIDDLAAAAVPASIRSTQPLDLPPASGESETTRLLRALASRWRAVLVGTAVAGLVLLPFALWDLRAFLDRVLV